MTKILFFQNIKSEIVESRNIAKIQDENRTARIFFTIKLCKKFPLRRYSILVRKPTKNANSTSSSGNVRRAADDKSNSNSKTSARTTNSKAPFTTNVPKNSPILMTDVDQQKQDKFKQILDQPTIDLGRDYISVFF